ncbi:MAG TPA: hypothetical protein VFQ43_06950, partial [Nitrososphaera sp.]|nr:hypothetical protein [Nitrososphaera sp.]
MDISRGNIRDALREIIEGNNVKRIRHDLQYEGRDLTQEFIGELQNSGYSQTTVGEVDVQPVDRVPAFCIQAVSPPILTCQR